MSVKKAGKIVIFNHFYYRVFNWKKNGLVIAKRIFLLSMCLSFKFSCSLSKHIWPDLNVPPIAFGQR